jgi:hypothetical protein
VAASLWILARPEVLKDLVALHAPCVAGRLKWTRQLPLRSTMKRPTCITELVSSPAQKT